MVRGGWVYVVVTVALALRPFTTLPCSVRSRVVVVLCLILVRFPTHHTHALPHTHTRLPPPTPVRFPHTLVLPVVGYLFLWRFTTLLLPGFYLLPAVRLFFTTTTPRLHPLPTHTTVDFTTTRSRSWFFDVGYFLHTVGYVYHGYVYILLDVDFTTVAGYVPHTHHTPTIILRLHGI